MNKNVRKIKFESLDKKFGGAVIYFPRFGKEKNEVVIAIKAIDVSNPLKIKVIKLTAEEKRKCLTFSMLLKPVTKKIREDMLKMIASEATVAEASAKISGIIIECQPEDHKWLYYDYERFCRVCGRIEPYEDKLRKAVNPKTEETIRFKPKRMVANWRTDEKAFK